MNVEYAYNCDKGRCKIFDTALYEINRYCHHKDSSLSIDKINKVPNLVWICTKCHEYIKNNYIPKLFGNKEKSKLEKYLKVGKVKIKQV